MSMILSSISLFFIPALITIILVYGLRRKTPMYDCFVSGAKDGLRTAVEMLPFIIAIFIGIQSLTASGAMEFFKDLLAPVSAPLGIPEELISLILLRPISGSGSLVLAEQIMRESGTDGLIGRAASVMTGSCETVFYVLAIYFGVTSVKKMRHAFHAGLIGYIVGVAASIAICRFI